MIRIANAPCSWGALEFDSSVEPPPASQVLDEIAESGYAGTELGDWGFLPTTAAALIAETDRRRLEIVGAFVPVALSRADAIEEGLDRAIRTARLLADAALVVARPSSRPILVLSDDNAKVPTRTQRAGRIADGDGLGAAEWDAFANRAERIARAVRDETGLRTAFHHHCAGYVETPSEIDALMSRTSADLVGLCLDTGHLLYGGGDPLSAIAKYGRRIWHVHFKDCDPRVAAQARANGWDYFTAIRHGIFSELGRGAVPFAAIRDALHALGYSGWIVVEQDVLPSLGTPLASARRNREYLRQLGM